MASKETPSSENNFLKNAIDLLNKGYSKQDEEVTQLREKVSQLQQNLDKVKSDKASVVKELNVWKSRHSSEAEENLKTKRNLERENKLQAETLVRQTIELEKFQTRIKTLEDKMDEVCEKKSQELVQLQAELQEERKLRQELEHKYTVLNHQFSSLTGNLKMIVQEVESNPGTPSCTMEFKPEIYSVQPDTDSKLPSSFLSPDEECEPVFSTTVVENTKICTGVKNEELTYQSFAKSLPTVHGHSPASGKTCGTSKILKPATLSILTKDQVKPGTSASAVSKEGKNTTPVSNEKTSVDSPGGTALVTPSQKRRSTVVTSTGRSPSPKMPKLVPQRHLSQGSQPRTNVISSAISTTTSLQRIKNHGLDSTKALETQALVCICGAKFAFKKNLAAHVQFFALGGKFQCYHCQDNFDTFVAMQEHCKNNHGDKGIPDNHKGAMGCQQCGVIFPSRFEFDFHQVSDNTRRRLRVCPVQLLTDN